MKKSSLFYNFRLQHIGYVICWDNIYRQSHLGVRIRISSGKFKNTNLRLGHIYRTKSYSKNKWRI